MAGKNAQQDTRAWSESMQQSCREQGSDNKLTDYTGQENQT